MRSASTLHDRATPPTSRRTTKIVRPSMARRTSLPDLSIGLGVRARDRSFAFAFERPFVRPGAPDDSLFIHAGGWGSSPCASRLAGERRAPGCPVAPACPRGQAVPTPSHCLLGNAAGSTDAFRHPRILRMAGGPFERAAWIEERCVLLPREGRDCRRPEASSTVASPSAPSPFDEAPIAKGIRMSGLSRASRLADRIRNTRAHGCSRPPASFDALVRVGEPGLVGSLTFR